MTPKKILTERVLNLHTVEEKEQYVDVIWDLLNKSYAKLGGFKSASSKEELLDIPGYWKVIKRGPDVTAVALYRKTSTTSTVKSYASGTETVFNPSTNTYRPTTRGKHDYLLIKKEDVTQKRAWTEASGPVEALMNKLGANPIPNKFAAFLTGKEILSYSPDGYHYTRLIQGIPHEKMIFGFIGLTPEQEDVILNNDMTIEIL